MKICILTFYRVENFGANLQALSTYSYLEKNKHEPIMLYYSSKEAYAKLTDSKKEKTKCHLEFIDRNLVRQTTVCFNSDEINAAI